MTIRSFVLSVLVTPLVATAAWGECRCDCDADGVVRLPEVVLAINIVLGSQSPAACSSLSQCSGDGACDAGIDTLVTCVQHALRGCPQSTPASTPTILDSTPTIAEPTATISDLTPTVPAPTPTIPPSTPTPTGTCTPLACTPVTCGPPLVLHSPGQCSCAFCATPTRTPTRTQTPTTTACRNVAPAAAPVTSPTEELSQEIFFCGIERGASRVNVEGAVTDRNERRSLSNLECPLRCPNTSQQCYAQPVQLQPDTTHRITIVQNRGICGGNITVEEDVFGEPLTIRQISLP